MPTYEYACKSCGEHLEVVQSFRDEALTTCPACGGELRKVFGAIGIAFKGSGFYKTDSRDSGKKPATTPAAAASGGDAKGDKGSSSPSSPPAPSSGSSSSTSSSGGDSKAAASS